MEKCPKCQSLNIWKNGRSQSHLKNFQKHICKDCGHHWKTEVEPLKYRAEEIAEYYNEHGEQNTITKYRVRSSTIQKHLETLQIEKKPRHAKILLIDIETFPLRCFAWDVWKQNIAPVQVIADRALICWAAKWLFSPEILSDCVTPAETLVRNDSRVCQSIWELMEQADVIIGHNGKDFDIKILNTRFLINGFSPPSPYQVIDTVLQARSQLKFIHNKLDFIGQILTNKNKLETNFKLWIRCDHGDQKSLDYMVKYNKQDVALLENAYLYLRPWMKSHPNMALLLDTSDPVCPTCGSLHIVSIDDHPYNTMVGTYVAFRCESCGAVSHGRTNQLSKEKRKVLISSSAR